MSIMTKKIIIGGTGVLLSAGAGALIHYKVQFGSEYTDDFGTVAELSGRARYEKLAETEMRLLWAMARAADKALPPPEEWLTLFGTEELFSASQAARELFLSTLENTKSPSSGGREFSSENLIASALACGLSVNDLDDMPLPMVLDTVSEWCRLKGYSEEEARPATQEDFDAL